MHKELHSHKATIRMPETISDRSACSLTKLWDQTNQPCGACFIALDANRKIHCESSVV